jgi:hypothetical protein
MTRPVAVLTLAALLAVTSCSTQGDASSAQDTPTTAESTTVPPPVEQADATGDTVDTVGGCAAAPYPVEELPPGAPEPRSTEGFDPTVLRQLQAYAAKVSETVPVNDERSNELIACWLTSPPSTNQNEVRLSFLFINRSELAARIGAGFSDRGPAGSDAGFTARGTLADGTPAYFQVVGGDCAAPFPLGPGQFDVFTCNLKIPSDGEAQISVGEVDGRPAEVVALPNRVFVFAPNRSAFVERWNDLTAQWQVNFRYVEEP